MLCLTLCQGDCLHIGDRVMVTVRRLVGRTAFFEIALVERMDIYLARGVRPDLARPDAPLDEEDRRCFPRRLEDSFYVGGALVAVIDLGPGRVTVGVTAEPTIPVHRGSVYQSILWERAGRSSGSDASDERRIERACFSRRLWRRYVRPVYRVSQRV